MMVPRDLDDDATLCSRGACHDPAPFVSPLVTISIFLADKNVHERDLSDA